jgi:hypothetical protein
VGIGTNGGKHKPHKTKVSDACRIASHAEHAKNGEFNKKGNLKVNVVTPRSAS